MAKESLIAMTKLLRMQEFVLSSCVSLSTPSAGYRNWERAGCPDMQRSRAFQPSQRRSGSTTPETKFDSDSGQVFTETKVRVNRKHGADWICEYKTPKLLKSHQAANGHGPRSLFQIAKSLLVRNFRSLTVDHFAATVPWEIAEKVWEEITITYVPYWGDSRVHLYSNALTAVMPKVSMRGEPSPKLIRSSSADPSTGTSSILDNPASRYWTISKASLHPQQVG